MKSILTAIGCWLCFVGFPASALAFPAADYYPLRQGDRWSGSKDGSLITETVSDSYRSKSGGHGGVVYSNRGDRKYVLNDAVGLRYVGGTTISTTADSRSVSINLDPPFIALAAEASLGQLVVSEGNAVHMIGVDRYSYLGYTGSSMPVRFETITVPAGTFTALRVEQQIRIYGNGAYGPVDIRSMETQWLVSGIGPVKSESATVSNGVTENSSYALHSYDVYAPDTRPDPFGFGPLLVDVAPGSLVESERIQVTGLSATARISVSGGEYRIWGDYTSKPGFIQPGDVVSVRQTAGANWSETTSAVLTIGGVNASFNVKTMAKAPSGNRLYFVSDVGDSIGQGTTVLIGEETVMSVAQGAGALLIVHLPNPLPRPASSDWYLLLNAADKDSRLVVGSYENAARASFAPLGTPGLEFYGNGRGCNTSKGRFDVLEAVYDADGKVQKFAVDFEQHCGGATPALRGELRFNSSIPTRLDALPVVNRFTAGWNLVGNSQTTPIQVATAFADTQKVVSVWKWISIRNLWAFYSPALPNGGADYAASKGYDALTSIEGGEGYWLNAASDFSMPMPVGTAVVATALSRKLHPGWNLASTTDAYTPRQVNAAIGQEPPGPQAAPSNINSLWAWDGARNKWYFYSPELDAKGGSALADYIGGKGYLDFIAEGKKVGPGIGFWLNRP